MLSKQKKEALGLIDSVLADVNAPRRTHFAIIDAINVLSQPDEPSESSQEEKKKDGEKLPEEQAVKK